jgi:hypothetical protein
MSDRANSIGQRIADMLHRHEDYVSTFETPQGQRVLRHLMRVSGVTGSNFVAGDPHTTAFKEGQRHIVMSILKFTKKDTEALIKQIEQGLENDE